MENLVIVWAWWWWYTAGLYAGRYAMKPVIVGAMDGWVIIENPLVENFPWFEEPTSWFAIMEKVKNQSLKYGAKYIQDKVQSVLPIDEKNFAKWYKITTELNGELEAKTVLLSIWTEKRMLGAPWEKDFFGKWVSYCATCDWFFYRWKTVAVVWWGDSALIEALYLSKICEKVYLIHRSDTFKAEPIRITKMNETKNIEPILNSEIEQIWWENLVQWTKIKSGSNTSQLDVNWIFIAIGMIPNKITWLDKWLKRDQHSYIIVSDHMSTNLPWVYAAWDCSTWSAWFRQLITACSEWAIAAESAFKYLSKG